MDVAKRPAEIVSCASFLLIDEVPGNKTLPPLITHLEYFQFAAYYGRKIRGPCVPTRFQEDILSEPGIPLGKQA